MKTNSPKLMYEMPSCTLIVIDQLSPLCQSGVTSFSTEKFEQQTLEGFSF